MVILYPEQISVIIVSYHTGDVLFESINSVVTQSEVAEVIVVNNGNPPDVEQKLTELIINNHQVKLLSGHGNIGFGAGCNLGAKFANSKYILLLNPDCVLVSAGGLAVILSALQNNSMAKMAGCLITNYDGSEQSTDRRNLLTLSTLISEILPFCRRFLPALNLGNLLREEGEILNVPAISGAFMLLENATYQGLGGIDERYFLHFEDLDFCMQMHKHGYGIIFVPSCVVRHDLSTSNVTSWFIRKHKIISLLRYIWKHIVS